MVNRRKTKKRRVVCSAPSASTIPERLICLRILAGRLAADLINRFHYCRTNVRWQRTSHSQATKCGKDFRLATQGKKLYHRETCFGARMFFDGAHQRIEFSGFRHQEQERKRI